ncbi:hypothetical protein PoB_001162200 [Plakobranchus ocellatus]|uniref:Uncharacterized protein n=1 Tax=Plakobranchus ocellatus TaxID=259542 RepID=A0AAV3YSJ6_9GAST|nr:hypothetical protein PoB_001162200 [Plakobranchus ocellatus]
MSEERSILFTREGAGGEMKTTYGSGGAGGAGGAGGSGVRSAKSRRESGESKHRNYGSSMEKDEKSAQGELTVSFHNGVNGGVLSTFNPTLSSQSGSRKQGPTDPNTNFSGPSTPSFGEYGNDINVP